MADDAGRAVTWSIADGARGRRWRWSEVDRRGALVVAHTLETDPSGRFLRLESACPAGLLTLHREADGSVHGNRVSERGVDHLTVEAPVPDGILVGATALGVAALAASLTLNGPRSTFDILEVFDDLGIRIAGVTIRVDEPGMWDVRTNRQAGRVLLDVDGLPGADSVESESWPLELG